MKAKFESLIEKPIAQVFDAIVDPNAMKHYFISDADNAMVEGACISWRWEDVGASAQITVTKIVPNALICFEWSVTGKPTNIEIHLTSEHDNRTHIKIQEGEWENNTAGVDYALRQTSGWTDFFNCLKAYLLFNVNLRSGKRIG